MRPWQKWDYFEWSEALLEHYFGVTENVDPVRALVVVGAELVRVVGDPEAKPDDVERLLVEKVVRPACKKGFWLHAKELMRSSKPRYLGHLVTACLAATDLDDTDENSYITRLAELTTPARGELNLEVMAELWRCLSRWLDDHSDKYRPLLLPDPGGWTRIGHTMKLAFPSRRDQANLAKLLSSRNLSVEDPPVGLVVSAVLDKRNTFSDQFKVKFNDFQRERADGIPLAKLRESPFWLAVRSTTNVGIADHGRRVHWALLASDDGYDLDLCIVSEDGVVGGSMETVELDEPIGKWTHTAKVSASVGDPVTALLVAGCTLPGVSQLVKGGVIPFVEELHGALESNGRREALPEAHSALVADPLVNEIRSRFGSPRSRSRHCGIEGWSFVEGLELRIASSAELQGTPLEQCWILHESPSPTRISVVGGVSVGTAWLGASHLLPGFLVEPAVSMVARAEGRGIALFRDEQGIWKLPPKELEGLLTVVAETEASLIQKQLKFVRSPSAEHFKVPGSPESWIYEDQARSRSFANRWPRDTSEITVIADAERTLYLGRDVGVFLDGPEGAAWTVTEFGATRIIRPLEPLTDCVPRGQVSDHGARRRWRKNLRVDAMTSCDPEVAAVLRRMVSNTKGQKDLPTVETGGDGRSLLTSPICPHPRLDDVVTAIIAISNNRVGIDRRWLGEFLREIFAIDPATSLQVVRAWQEAELLDELVNVRWSGRRWVAASPHLSVFRVPSGIRATFSGLSLTITAAELASIAKEMGMAVASIGARSPFVPSTVIFQADSLEQITELAARQRFNVRYVPVTPFLSHNGRDLNNDPPRIGYRAEPAETVGETVELIRKWQRHAPSFWTIRCGDFTTWTHFLEAARFWARCLAGTLKVDLSGPFDFTFGDIRIPLAMARWLSAIGGARSGPTGPASEDPYLYSAPTAALRTRLLAELRRFEVDSLASLKRQPEEEQLHV